MHRSLTDGFAYEVQLMCEPTTGCGFTITGSRSSGIAVKSLMPGGIADQDGRLEVGDKMLAINEMNVWLLTCGQVARCLRQSQTVRLLMFRPDYGIVKLKRESVKCRKTPLTSTSSTCSGYSTASGSSLGSYSSQSQPYTDMEVMSPQPKSQSPVKRRLFKRSLTASSKISPSSPDAMFPTSGQTAQNMYYPAIRRTFRRFLSFVTTKSDSLDGDENDNDDSNYTSLQNSQSASSELDRKGNGGSGSRGGSCAEIESSIYSTSSSYELIQTKRF